MNRVDAKFRELKKEGRAALIPYVMAGYPTLDLSERIIDAVAKGGADLIEVGIPYSDPLADGVTIQRAAEVALSQGVATDDVFRLVARVRGFSEIPLVLMTYYNTVYRLGLPSFARQAAAAGVDGVICPDLPPEEAADWVATADRFGLDTVFLVAPTSTDERIEKVVAASHGFVYCVSLTGVTGARRTVSSGLAALIARVRARTDKPLAVGFGISTVQQAKEVAKLADGVIIGSALLDRIAHQMTESDQASGVAAFVHGMRKALADR